jgi:hypothetical protein
MNLPKATVDARSSASAPCRFRAAGDLGGLEHGEDLTCLELYEPVKPRLRCPTPVLDWSWRLTHQCSV